MSARFPLPQGPRADRRRFIAGLLGFGVLGSAAGPALAAAPPSVVMLGDSVTAGYGLAAADALPAQLQAELQRLGHPARVVAAGVSGDTTADGLARVDFSVPDGTSLCIVELGGNDLLQGVDPAVARRNLQAILARLKARRIPVLLVAIAAPASIGAAYARDFDAIFAAAAKVSGAPVFADWRAVVADPALQQADHIHPNARGAHILASKLAPAVVKALPKSR